MVKRLRSTWFAGSGAMVLVLSISGLVAAATITAAGLAPVTAPVTAAQPFVDLNGDGIDDTCQTGVVADLGAAAAAEAAVDLNHDGVISVSEAAASGRIGGKNCNHGGYVSGVAHTFGQACDGTETAAGTETSDTSEADANAETVTTVTTTTETTTSDATTSDTTTCTTDSTVAAVTTSSETSSTTTCTTTTSSTTDTTTTDTTTTDTAPNAHGKSVSEVAQSDAVGGKNCNHGGAVSEAAHQNHAARDAAKAARNAARDARKLNKVHGKGHNH
jgi:hypothetical protein